MTNLHKDAPGDGRLRTSVSLDDETKERIVRVRHLVEIRDRRPITVSEVFREALREFEKSLAVAS